MRAHREAGGFFGGPEGATEYQPVSERPGDTIGLYKLLQQIGEGGMGVVYMAEQTEPIERRVALKIIKPGMDTRQVIARFEAERQALAMMDHPNISKVFDAGVTDTGRPYFVMELVKGTPIIQYCDEHKIPSRERLELFIPVCQAIQHAHQKGIIHRDIKPSNVLVAHYDDTAVPKVIDFGVAKAVDHRLTEKTMFTEFGQVLGTFEYMSPEQAKLNQWDVDTRTDVYSLGVLLYELLAGEVPFDRQRLRSAAIDELLRIIREEDPPRPSTRVSSSQSLPTIAANRKTEPKKLSTLIHGELDWIVMKALEKERTRRYDTASKFAEDVEHYLNNEAVEACPPSAAYRFRKFVRRNRPVIGTLVAVAAALVIGASVAVWQAIEADIERDRAIVAERAAEEEARRANEEAARADKEANRAVAEANRAERQLARAEEVKQLVSDMLNGAAPAVTLGADPTVLIKILDETAERLEAGEIEDEVVAAELHWIVGRVYSDLGRDEDALEHFKTAVEDYRRLKPNHIDRANVLGQLGNVYRQLTRYSEAEERISEALRLSRTHDERSIFTAGTMGDLATTWYCQGKYQQAEQMFLDALDILNEHVQEGKERSLLKNHLNNLGNIYLDMHRYEDARQRYQEALDSMTDVAAGDPDRLSTLGNLAIAVGKLGDLEEAESIRKEVLAEYERIVDESHPSRLAAKHNLASSYDNRAKRTGNAELRKRAKRMYREIIDVRDASGNTPHSVYPVINAKSNLAGMLGEDGDFSQAAELQEEVIDELVRNKDPMVYRYRLGLAQVYFSWGQATQDPELLEKARQILEGVLALESGGQAIELSTDDRTTAKRLLVAVLGQSLEDDEALEQVDQIVKELQEEQVGTQKERQLNTVMIAVNYQKAWMHHQRDEYAEAAEIYSELVQVMEGNPDIKPQWRLGTNANLGFLLLRSEKYKEARSVLEPCLVKMRVELPEEHEFTENVIRWIAETYENLELHDMARQRYAEALDLQVGRFYDDGNPATLNHLAWQLLTHQYRELRDPKRALPLAQRACNKARQQPSDELCDYLDTLALAQYETGNTVAAVDTQREAIELLPSTRVADRVKYVERLAEYEAALRDQTEPASDD
nr:tetratricopeptide repeat protein [Aeoliella straminimaris]